MLDTNCNNFLMESINNISVTPNMKELKKIIVEKEIPDEEGRKQADIFVGMIDELMKANPNYDINQFWKIYDMKKNLLKSIVNSSPYISYVPVQVAETLSKAIKNINSIEIIGCEGYKKIKKISKIK